MMKLGKVVLASAALLLAIPAFADVVNPASIAAGYQYYRFSDSLNIFNNLVGDTSKALVASNGPPTMGLPYVSSVATPFGVVSTFSNTASVEGWYATVGTQISYSIRVVGDDTYNQLIPVDYTAYLSAVAIGDSSHNVAEADANLAVSSYFTNYYRSAVCTSGCVGTQLGGLLVNDSISTRVNGIIGVTLSARTEAVNYGSATAFADPYFFIDPTFLGTHPGFSLQISEGIGNDPRPGSGAVPEPDSWTMMMSGVGIVGALMRRKRKVRAKLVFG